MIKRLIFIIISLIMILAFCGCQLAEQGKGTATNTDALCGMFITFEPLYSEEDYLDDIDWSAVIDGGQQMYQAERKPIYASERTDTVLGGKDYYFEGRDGIRMFNVLVKHNDSNYWAPCSDYELLEVSNGISESISGGDSLTLEGTLYVYINPEVYNADGDCVYYCNPVYQDSEGRVYTVPADCGTALYTSSDSIYYDGEGEPANFTVGNLWSDSISCNTTRKTDGREESWSSKIILNIVGIYNINKYVLKQMDAQDNVISTLEITEGNIPKEITLNDNTAYAILEEHSTDVSGKVIVERSVVNMKLDFMDVRFPNEKGFALVHRIPLKNIPVSNA